MPAPQTLAEFRRAIDTMDDEIVRLITTRLTTAIELATSKQNATHFRPGREADVLRRLVAAAGEAIPPLLIEGVWRQIMTASLALQTEASTQSGLRVAVVDEAGVLATARWRFGAATTLVACASSAATLGQLAAGEVDLAVLPHWQDSRDRWRFAKKWRDSTPPVWLAAQIPFFALADTTGNGMPFTRAAIFACTKPDRSHKDATLFWHNDTLIAKPGHHLDAPAKSNQPVALGVFQTP